MGSIKVRDLAADLGVSYKEILQVLRDLDIQVKSQVSTLEDDEAKLVRQRLAQGVTVTEVIKEVQPGVVRRRRKKVLPSGTEEAGEAAETPIEETPLEVEVAPPVEEPVAPETAESDISAEGDEDRELREAAARDAEFPEFAEPEPEKTPAKIKERFARVIAPVKAPEAEAPAVQAAESDVSASEAASDAAGQTAPEASEEKPVLEAEETGERETAEETPAEAEAKVEAETPAETEVPSEERADADARGRKKDKDKKKEKFSGPQVRIISRPDPAAAKPAPKPAPRPAAPGTPGAPAGDDARAPRRDRRVVEFRNTPAPEAPRPAAPARPTDGKGKKGKKGKREHPGASRREDMAPKHLMQPRRGQQPVAQPQTTQPMKAAKRKLRIEDAIRVGDMAHQMGVKAPEIIRVLMGLGVLATINQSLDIETAGVVATEFGYEVEKVGFSEETFLIPSETDKPEDMKPRPPVVTIMGHVDHGKTSLLDAIRSSDVTAGEAGGITQHIGAYHVQTARGEVVFLDTPGHEAFTAMRARGAKVTDIVVLVVAADDGVMEQTREAINHSKAAGVPLVVAVNKMDKEGANPDRVKRELSELGMMPEEWGGETIYAYVSAKQRQGLDELLEMILLQAEVLELKANPDKPARGHIVEAKLDKGRGSLGTLLISEGTLRQGDAFVCGLQWGKVRAMFNDQGKKIKKAGPAMPVEVQGFDGLPEAGDEFVCVADEKVARRIADERQMKQRERELAKESKVTLESFLKSKPDQDVKTLNLVVKTDVQGSLEAIADALAKASTEKVKINIIHSGAGAITESDILLASASEAIIIGFNVRPNAKVKDVADQQHVEIRFYDIIYKLVGEIRDAMAGMLAPVISENYLGQAEVRELYHISRIGTIAGCGVIDGKIRRDAKIRLIRDGVVVHTGEMSSLKRFKDDVKEVSKGYECGITINNYNDIKTGDIIEAFEFVESAATL
ncbi:initiation factor 2 [Alkalidesulfovibrio alkalitolerans DSM 16529]|uniref:Translation initiation factor IF-2 n=1 Tax=Alkalidesulfovibrio alkalitolerans DSM 16529 TaxID=1121439 RepID=S7TCL7_9BACT|nr:translation initiation factor IF-2 [Alkalidesulfovibrio alkalitolerans]EPR34972.1 initiation factor 2 [Alkalidesulfovibrio alkalitolerans DSM 16529]